MALYARRWDDTKFGAFMIKFTFSRMVSTWNKFCSLFSPDLFGNIEWSYFCCLKMIHKMFMWMNGRVWWQRRNDISHFMCLPNGKKIIPSWASEASYKLQYFDDSPHTPKKNSSHLLLVSIWMCLMCEECKNSNFHCLLLMSFGMVFEMPWRNFSHFRLAQKVMEKAPFFKLPLTSLQPCCCHRNFIFLPVCMIVTYSTE